MLSVCLFPYHHKILLRSSRVDFPASSHKPSRAPFVDANPENTFAAEADGIVRRQEAHQRRRWRRSSNTCVCSGNSDETLLQSLVSRTPGQEVPQRPVKSAGIAGGALYGEESASSGLWRRWRCCSRTQRTPGGAEGHQEESCWIGDFEVGMELEEEKEEEEEEEEEKMKLQ